MTTVTSPIGTELLDGPSCPDGLARTTFRDISRANALLGGRAAARWGLDRILPATVDRPLSLLDVGAGGGDIARHLVAHAARRGLTLRAVALDRHRAAARLCDDTGLPSVVADLWRLPVADRSVDLVLVSQVLHHFSREAAGALLAQLTRAARVGVVVADLRRSPVAAAGIWLAARALGFHPVTRQDGVTSVRRGFTVGELARLLLSVGIRATVARRPGYRVVAAWRVGLADG